MVIGSGWCLDSFYSSRDFIGTRLGAFSFHLILLSSSSLEYFKLLHKFVVGEWKENNRLTRRGRTKKAIEWELIKWRCNTSSTLLLWLLLQRLHKVKSYLIIAQWRWWLLLVVMVHNNSNTFLLIILFSFVLQTIYEWE